MVRKRLGKRVADAKSGGRDAVGPKKVKKTPVVVVQPIDSFFAQAEKDFSSSSAPIDAKLSSLSSFFATILQENVKLPVPKTDFHPLLSSILRQCQGHEPDLWPLLTTALKLCPKAFEPLLVKILPLALEQKEEDEGKVFEKFVTELVSTFDKLKKIPTFVDKLLFALRQTGEKKVAPLLATIVSLVGPFIGGLGAGQIKYLWRKLQWNAEVLALKGLKADADDKALIVFFSSVVALYVEFLSNIPPEPTFAEMMPPLREQLLRPLGILVAVADAKQKKLEPELLKSFLRLGLAYGELQGRFFVYCDEFRHVGDELKSNLEGADLSLLHPYLESKIVTRRLLEIKNCDEEVAQLLINLLVQKLRFTSDLSPNSSLTATAELIWSVLQSKPKLLLTESTLGLVKRHLGPDQILSLPSSSSLVTHNESLSNRLGNSRSSPRLHFSLIFQTLKEVLQRLSRMASEAKSTTASTLKVTLESMNFINISSFLSQNLNPNSICPLTELLVYFVNSLLERPGPVFSLAPISNQLSSLAGLELEEYPENVKNVIFLTSIACAMMSKEGEESLSILLDSSSGSDSTFPLFKLDWKRLFSWCWRNLAVFGAEFRPKTLRVILKNVDKRESGCGLLDKDAVDLNSGWKLDPKTASHASIVTYAIVMSLPTTGEMSSSLNFYKNCLSAQTAFKLKLMNERSVKVYKQKLPALIKIGFETLKNSGTLEDERNLILRTNAIKFLGAVFISREEFRDGELLGDEKLFLEKLWKHYLESFGTFGGLGMELFQKMKKEELSQIGAGIVDRIKGSMSSDSLDRYQISSLLSILIELWEAELSNADVKFVRRHVFQDSMDALKGLPQKWDKKSLKTVIIPYITLQTKLIRRRGALLNKECAVVFSLNVVHCCPLDQLNSTSSFRRLFVALTAMLKAVTIHGLDVLEIGSNAFVYLQAFQCLISALGSKAEQKEGQSDEELSDLATCANAIERLCNSMKEGASAFWRVGPKLIAFLIQQFDPRRALDPVVKKALMGGCFKLLDLCDIRGAAVLDSLLTPGEAQLLGNIKSTKDAANFN